MGVTVREVPKGSGRWVIYISKGSARMNYTVKGGKERAQQVADQVAAILDLVGFDGVAEFLRRGTRSSDPVPTVKTYATRWLEYLDKTDLKRSTRMMYESNVRNHIVPGLGTYLVTEVDYALLKDFLSGKTQYKYSSGRFRSPSTAKQYAGKAAVERRYSRDTIRIMAMTLRAIFREAVKDGLLPTNPVEGLSQFYRKKRRDVQVRRSDIYTLEELHAVEDVLAARRTIFGEDLAFSMMMSRTGVRIGEARGIMISDLDPQEHVIHIRRNFPSGHHDLEDSPKTEHSERAVDVSPELEAELGEMLRRRREALMATGMRLGADAWMFPGPSGAPVDYKGFYDRWNRAQALAGVRQRSPHSLRHTFASQMLAAGADIAYIARQLGHANPSITLSIYVHFIPGKSAGVRGVLDREFASKLHQRAGDGEK